MHEIETARLRLRMLTRADLAELTRIVADPEVMKYLGRVPGPLTAAEAEAFFDSVFAHWERHGFGRWAVVEKSTGQLVGCAGFRSHEGQAELNYLLDRPHWGRGLGTEMASACLRAGFVRHGFGAVVAFTRPENAASRRVLEKAGMRYEGEAETHGVASVRYAITREEFERRGGAGRPDSAAEK
jgi:ribosomal-protein-alanine N-acetyltransferase